MSHEPSDPAPARSHGAPAPPAGRGSDRLVTALSGGVGGGPRRKGVLALSVAGLLLLLSFTAWTGVRGLDFGHHWDEGVLLGSAAQARYTGVLLPHFYNYPSVWFWLCLASDPPPYEELRPALEGGAAPEAHGRMRAFRLRARHVFLAATLLALPWVFLLVLTLGRSPLEALLAAALLGLSWQVAYHARWIAPDGVLLQLAALTLLLCAVAVRSPRPPWLLAAAVAAGLACGTKYTGGHLLLAVLLALLLDRSAASRRARTATAMRLALVFAATYLVTTPGTLLDQRFLLHVGEELFHYSERGHGGHTIAPGGPHLAANALYLGGALLSPYRPVAFAFAGAAVAGAFLLWCAERRTATVLLLPAGLFFVYLGLQRVHLVRNLLVFAPLLAVLAARGAAAAVAAPGPRAVRVALAAALAGALALNGIWLHRAAETIEDRGTGRFRAEAAAFVADNPGETFVVGPALAEELGVAGLPNVLEEHEDPDALVMVRASGLALPPLERPATGPSLTVRWFGPHEVDFDRYPDWEGDDRILLLRQGRARSLGLLPAR